MVKSCALTLKDGHNFTNSSDDVDSRCSSFSTFYGPMVTIYGNDHLLNGNGFCDL